MQMPTRRLLTLAAGLFEIEVVAASVAPRDPRSPGAGAPAPAPVPHAGPPEVRATLPSDEPVRARVGDLVSLRVRSDTPDQAEITALGLSEPAGDGLPAELLFVADEPGRYPVRLSLAGREVGVVQVAG